MDDIRQKIRKAVMGPYGLTAVKFDSELEGEPNFELNGGRYRYVNGIYLSGRKDMAVCDLSTDLAYDYGSFRKVHNLDN